MFFQWITRTPVAGLTLIGLVVILVLGAVIIYLVAFIQGREISLWPPKIGAKPFYGGSDSSLWHTENAQDSRIESRNSTGLHGEKASPAIPDGVQARPKTPLPILHLNSQPIALLEGINGSVGGNIYIILAEHRRVLIGSDPSCELPVINSRMMSPQHCAVLIKGIEGSKEAGRNFRFELVDMLSTNGSFLNGTYVGGEPARINDGDLIQAGDCTFRFFILNKGIQ